MAGAKVGDVVDERSSAISSAAIAGYVFTVDFEISIILSKGQNGTSRTNGVWLGVTWRSNEQQPIGLGGTVRNVIPDSRNASPFHGGIGRPLGSIKTFADVKVLYRSDTQDVPGRLFPTVIRSSSPVRFWSLR